MKFLLSLLVLACLGLAVAAWDPATFSWVPQTLWYFVDIPQLLYVSISALSVTLIIHPWRDLTTAVSLVFRARAAAEKERTIEAMRALLFCGQMAWWSGVVVTGTEVVIAAHNSASLAEFVSALGVAALGMLYGLLGRVASELGAQVLKVRLGPFVFYGQ